MANTNYLEKTAVSRLMNATWLASIAIDQRQRKRHHMLMYAKYQIAKEAEAELVAENYHPHYGSAVLTSLNQ